jgi:uncharacterized membrane protein YeaQ/YmgE (transglycosylase-associated protein family)
MGIIAWLILGVVAGLIASALTGSREGLLVDVGIGIVGAFIGGFIASLVGHAGVTGLNVWSLFIAVVGAVILILVVRAVRNRS